MGLRWGTAAQRRWRRPAAAAAAATDGCAVATHRLALETLYCEEEDWCFRQLLADYARQLSTTVPQALLRCWTDCMSGPALRGRWAEATDFIEQTFRGLGSFSAEHVWEAVVSCLCNEQYELYSVWPAPAVIPLARVASTTTRAVLGGMPALQPQPQPQALPAPPQQEREQ